MNSQHAVRGPSVRVCPSCKTHALILLSDGARTDVFATKKHGREITMMLLDGQHIDRTECFELLGRIQSLDFVEEDDRLDSEMKEHFGLPEGTVIMKVTPSVSEMRMHHPVRFRIASTQAA